MYKRKCSVDLDKGGLRKKGESQMYKRLCDLVIRGIILIYN